MPVVSDLQHPRTHALFRVLPLQLGLGTGAGAAAAGDGSERRQDALATRQLLGEELVQFGGHLDEIGGCGPGNHQMEPECRMRMNV